jgi:D-inositol-3-phosphate glycosyltransferase
VLTGSAPTNSDTVSHLVPQPPWLGTIDVPAFDEVVRGQVALIAGWALLGGRAPNLVEVLIDGRVIRARTRLPRPDVAGVHPTHDDAWISGFQARVPIDLPPGAERVLTLRVRCRSEGVGERYSPPHRFVLRNPAADPDEGALAEVLAGQTAAALARVTVPTDPRHLLVFTHSLAIGGAELWLQELLSRLVTDHGWQVSVVSEADGPLRGDCARLGIPVHVTGNYRSSTVAGYEGHVAELARFVRCSGAGAALVNTLGAFVAADAAKRAGLPTVWAIHESFALPDFAHMVGDSTAPPPAVLSRWHSTLAEVDRLLFVADATRELFLPYSKPERCQTIRYGTPMWTFGGRTDPQVRERARAALGYRPDDVLLVTVGVADPRKGLGPLVSAVELVRARHPAARLAIVGLRPTQYGRALTATVRRAALDGIVRLVPVQRDPTPWLQAADVFVNCSDVESLPRSILEAVCCGVPVAATDIFGAREMITDGRTGWLFEPNDVDALAAVLLRALETTPQARRDLADAAHRGLSGWLDPSGYARDYDRLLSELTAERARP